MFCILSEMTKYGCPLKDAYHSIATGLGIQLLPAIVIVKDWFDKRRPLALTVTSAADAISIFIGPPLGQVSG